MTREQAIRLVIAAFVRWLRTENHYVAWSQAFKPYEKDERYANLSFEKYVFQRIQESPFQTKDILSS